MKISTIAAIGVAGLCLTIAFTVSAPSVIYPESEWTDSEITRTYLIDDGLIEVDYDRHIVYETTPIREITGLLTAHRYITIADPVIKRTYSVLEPALSDMDDYDKADYLRKFVQNNTHYGSDMELHDVDDYGQYPSETLLTGKGDCEDTSYLLLTLYVMAGLDAVLVHIPDHVFVGVAVDGSGEYANILGSKTKYYTVETTSNIGIGKYTHQGDMFAYHPGSLMFKEMTLFYCLMGLIVAFAFNRTEYDEKAPRDYAKLKVRCAE